MLANKAGLFSPGLFARVRVHGHADYAALLLPDEAIGTDQTNKYRLVVGDDGTVARRNVKLGPLVEGLRVVREGLCGRRLGDHQAACSAPGPASRSSPSACHRPCRRPPRAQIAKAPE